MDVELRAKRDALEYLWRQGLSGRDLLLRHSELIDDFLIRAFAACPGAGQGMALVALGGYGRRELFPYSDIDLLLLYNHEVEEQLGPVIEALFYPLWNVGLEVGHSVRSAEACLVDARADFFFQVSLLDARRLAGSESLYEEMREAFRREIIDGHRREFLRDMMLHRGKRHQRYGMHSHRLEPQIKEGQGGFRDIHAMIWVAQALFGMWGLDAIAAGGLLSLREKEAFAEATDHLIRIRNRLHYLSGRKNDQLFFEHQEELAKAFKYHDADGVLAVERFMQDVYRQMQVIATVTDLFFEQVDESLSASGLQQQDQPLEPGIVVRQGRVHLIDRELLAKKPLLLMRLFAQSGRTGLPIHHRSRKLVAENLHLVDDRLRCSKRMARAFFEVLEYAEDLSAVLSAMLETGLLTAYIPEFGRIQALAQHDVYHVFTVDRHLIETVVELRKIGARQTLFGGVESPQVLALAALLHDIGKGHQEDHSRRGGELVVGIAQRMGLTESESACLRFLVEKHLFLTLTALRRDLDDDSFVQQCAGQVETVERLAMLHRLSIADAMATGPTAWNEWKAALLLELTLKIAHLLERQDLLPPDRGQGARWMLDRIRDLVGEEPLLDSGVLPEEYLLAFEPQELVEHIRLHAALKRKKKKEAIFRHRDQGICWALVVMARDSTGLLARICGSLALHDLRVVGAQIFTWKDGTAVDVLQVRPAAGQAYEEQDWQKLASDLDLALANRLGLSHRLGDKFRSLVRPIGQKAVSAPPRVVIDNESSALCSIVEVYADYRPGLLYDITRTLADFEIDIRRARIASEGDQVVDVFYVQDGSAAKIDSPAFREEIIRALLHAAGRVGD